MFIMVFIDNRKEERTVGVISFSSRLSKFKLDYNVWAIYVDNRAIFSRMRLSVKGDQTRFYV